MAQPLAPKSNTTLLDLFGVNCRVCATQVQVQLENAPGVTEVQLRFAQRQAMVRFDPHLTEAQHLVDRLHAAGYGAMSQEAPSRTGRNRRGNVGV